MITRILQEEEKNIYNSIIIHPVQTWEWGDFLISQGHKVYRLGVFQKGKIISAYSMSFHKIPKTRFSIGILQRGPKINQETVSNIKKIAKDENAIFVKLEPDVYQKIFGQNDQEKFFGISMDFPGLVVSPKVAFFPHTYLINLEKPEEEILVSMHHKTRYNIRVANRHAVEVFEKTNDSGFEIYLKLLFETTKRQGFYLHTEKYHRDLWNTLKNTGTIHILLAKYRQEILATNMFFALKDRFFYPYGASSHLHKEVMASTLLMWEAIKLGKKLKCKSFDMWGSLGPNAKTTEDGYGFHNFKKGFGGRLVQFVGTYDLVINQPLYKLYNIVDKYRWKLLRLKAKLFRH